MKTLKLLIFGSIILIMLQGCVILQNTRYFLIMDWLNLKPYLPEMTRCGQCNNFTYPATIENAGLCPDSDVFLVMLVTSYPTHWNVRDVIRDTWGSVREHRGYRIRLMFVLGRPKAWDGQKMLETESEKYKDILQGDFHDSYMTLTNKTIWGLNWVSRHCSNVKFLLKTDDDVLNVPQRLVDHLSALPNPDLDFVGGFRRYASTPFRQNSKFFTPPTLYNASHYPVYCMGPAYVLSMTAIRKIVNIATDVRFLPWEDVFVTGLCRAACRMDYAIIQGIEDDRPVSDCELATWVVSQHRGRGQTLKRRWAVVIDIAKRRDCERQKYTGTVLLLIVILISICCIVILYRRLKVSLCRTKSDLGDKKTVT